MSRDSFFANPVGILIVARVVLISVLLGTFLGLGFFFGENPWPLAVWIAVLYGLTVVYALLFPRYYAARGFAAVQLGVDVLAETALIAITGGNESLFSFTYLLTIIAAVILLSRTGGLWVAVGSVTAYGLVLAAQSLGTGFLTPAAGSTLPDILYMVFSHGVAFSLVTVLTGYLAERLRSTAKSLEETDVRLSDLQVFSNDILENVPVGLVTADLDGTVVMANRAAELACRCREEAMLGRNIIEVFPFLRHWQAWAPRAEGYMQVDDTDLVLGYSLSPLKNRHGRITGSVLIFRDLTDIRAMEEEVRRKQELAAIGELAASIAHELRNPLASLKNSIEILREEEAAGRYSARLMDIAVHEMDRLNAIITDFLAYARPTQPDLAECDLGGAVRDTLLLLEPSPGVRVEERIRATLPVRADDNQLRQVIWNLVINAVEAVGDRGVVSVETIDDPPDAVLLLVRDSGAGVAPGDREKIFYPFYSTKQRGTGLGLAISYRIVEAHGGTIELRQPPEGGAEFVVRLKCNG